MSSGDRRIPRGWHSRHYLPHLNAGETPQMVTFREAESLPRHLIEYWQALLAQKPDDAARAAYMARLDVHLDRAEGPAYMRDPAVASLVQSALLHFDSQRHRLLAWVVMSNHVHVVLVPLAPHDLTAIVQSWKGWTAREANRLLGRHGAFWAPDYFDRYIRSERHLAYAVEYVEMNPVKTHLCDAPEQWAWSSARARSEGALG